MTEIEKETKKEDIIEGIIIKADFGYGMKYKDEENLYLKLNIQQFDGHECVQLFGMKKVGKLLLQFKGDYHGELSLSTLVHRRVFLLNSDQTNLIPNAIAKLPPSEFEQYSWIYNDNWN
jgi:hypothetical protein